MDDTSGLAPGAMLGKYRLEGLLGRGGMGEVWAAHDPDLDRKVALKVLRASTGNTEEGQARLLREGRAMARLRHPNVITVYEATSVGGRDLIAMELVEGESLAGWLAGRRTADEIVHALLAAGRGLAAAHAAGMVHRDFKPHNVLVDRDGRVAVTDFGLARAIEAPPDPPERTAFAPTDPGDVAYGGGEPADSSLALDETAAATPPPRADPAREPVVSAGWGLAATAGTGSGSWRDRGTTTDRGALHSPLTRTGALLGTPAYMAPEQLDGRPADARSDQFAFCVTAWEALARKRPFEGKSLPELRDAVDAGVPSAGDQLPGRLRAILERGLARDPAQRWPAMDALLRALERAWRRPRRIATAAALAGAVAVAAAIPIAMWLRGGGAAGGCPSFEEAFGPAQSKPMRAIVHKIKAYGPAGVRAVAGLDRWRAEWRDVHAAACSKPADPDYLARRSCLEGLRDTLIEFFGVADQVEPWQAATIDIAIVLPPPSSCFDHPRSAMPAPPDPAIRDDVRRIRAEVVKYRVGVGGSPEDAAAALDKLTAQAEATGYLPLVANAVITKADVVSQVNRRAGCAIYEQGNNLAEQAGDDRDRLLAIFGLIECAHDLPERRAELEPLIARAGGVIARMDDPGQAAILDNLRSRVLANAGRWDDAIELAAATRATYQELGAVLFSTKAAAIEAALRTRRHRGDDLQRAEQLLREALDLVVPDDKSRVESLRGDLANLLWTRGRLDEAVAMYETMSLPAPTGGVKVAVRVVGADGAPVANAEVVAGVDPVGDPLRLAMSEERPRVTARTAADGVATIDAPAGGVIMARKKGDLAAAPVPAAAGELRLSLRPGVTIEGHVAIDAAPVAGEPRAGMREPAIALVSTRVGDRRWALAAPVDDNGRWRLGGVVPGRYWIEVATVSALGDTQAALATADVAKPTAIDLLLPAPAPLRVIARPAFDGVLIAVPGAHAVTGWAGIAGVLARASAATTTRPAPPETAGAGDVRTGDSVTLIGAPGAGAITVCALPGADFPSRIPRGIVVPGPDATPPACVTTTAAAGAITTVIVPTAR